MVRTPITLLRPLLLDLLSSSFGRRAGWGRCTHLEGLAALVDSNQVGHKFSCHLQGHAVAMSALYLLSMQGGHLRVPARRQFDRFEEHRLQPCIALFGDGPRCCLPAEDRKAAVRPQ